MPFIPKDDREYFCSHILRGYACFYHRPCIFYLDRDEYYQGNSFGFSLRFWSYFWGYFFYSLGLLIKNNPNLFVYGGILIIIYGLFSFFKERKDYRLHPPQTRIVEIKEGNYFTFFYKGFFLNIINVGVFFYWVATIATFSSSAGTTTTKVLVFLGTILLTYLLTDIVKILIAKRLRHKLTPTNIHKIKQGIHIFLVIFGIFLLLNGVFPNALAAVKEAFL